MSKSLVLLAALATLLGIASPAPAQYPAKPVKLVVPFPPGGLLDIVARTIAPSMTTGLGQALVIENRAGAAGTVGMDAVAKSAADGYTIAMGSAGTLASAPSLYPNLAYDPLKSFTPINLLVNAPVAVVVGPAVAIPTLRGLIDLAKASPGQLNFGSLGNGGPPHIAGEMFKQAAGVDLAHIPYKGMPPAVADLLTGRIHVMFNQIAPFQAHLGSGKLRALAIAGRERMSNLPGVPTAAEAGLPGFEVSLWFGLVAPAGTAPEVIQRLDREAQKALATREVRDALAQQGFEVAGLSARQFESFLAGEIERWTRAVKLSGARLD